MRKGAFQFSDDWTKRIRDLGETGMGYVVTYCHAEGCPQVRSGGYRLWLAGVRGLPDIPFRESDVAAIHATHDKWNWRDESPNT
jgi:hypothetical protein